MKAPKKTLWLAFAFLVVVIGILLFEATRPPVLPPAVTILPSGYKIPPQKASIPDRWISRKWGWYWRLKQRVFGPPKIISLGAMVFECTVSTDDVLSGFGTNEVIVTNSSGLHILIAKQAALTAIRERLEKGPVKAFRVIGAPRLTTGDASQTRMMMSTRVLVGGVPTDVGVVLDCLPRIHKSSTDLTTLLTVSEAVTNRPELWTAAPLDGQVSIMTNLDVAVRLQIPHGSGVLLLDASLPSNAGTITGVILSLDTSGKQSGFSSRVTRVIALPASKPAPGR